MIKPNHCRSISDINAPGYGDDLSGCVRRINKVRFSGNESADGQLHLRVLSKFPRFRRGGFAYHTIR